MQRVFNDSFIERMVFYSDRAWNDLLETDIIIICDFDVFPDEKDYVAHIEVMNPPITLDESKTMQCTNHVCMTFINLAKFNLSADQVKTDREKWCYFLKNLAENDDYVMKVINNDTHIEHAYERINKFCIDPDMMKLYEEDLVEAEKIEDDYDSMVVYAAAQAKVCLLYTSRCV